MRQLSIFDDNVRIATITQTDKSILIFARTPREWSEMKRLTSYANSKDKDFLEQLAEKAHGFNYSTEISDI